MATKQNFVTLGDLFEETGLKPLTFERNKARMAKEAVTFCVSNVERKTSKINNEEVEQWMLTIHYDDDKGREYDKLMPLPLSELVRNDILEAIKNKLEAMPINNRMVHGLMLEAVEQVKYANPYYNVVKSPDACMHVSDDIVK
jgi:hypothetical protein